MNLAPSVNLAAGAALYADVRADALVTQARVLGVQTDLASTLANAISLKVELGALQSESQRIAARAHQTALELIDFAGLSSTEPLLAGGALQAATLLDNAALRIYSVETYLVETPPRANELADTATSLFTSTSETIFEFSTALSYPLVDVQYTFQAAAPIFSPSSKCGFSGQVNGEVINSVGLAPLENQPVAEVEMTLVGLDYGYESPCSGTIAIEATRTIFNVPDYGEVVTKGIASIDFIHIVDPTPCVVAFTKIIPHTGDLEVVCFEEFHIPEFGLQYLYDPIVGKSTSSLFLTGAIGSPFQITGAISEFEGQTFGFTSFTPANVPEPSTFFLFLMGLPWLLTRRWFLLTRNN